MIEDIGDVLRWFGVRGLITPALGLDIDGFTVLRNAFGALLQYARFLDRQVDLLWFNILNLTAHWRCVDIQAAQNIGGSVHAQGATGQLKVIVTAVDLNA